MIATQNISELVGQILTRPNNGVVGLVSDLLTLCRSHAVRLDWQEGNACRISFPDNSEVHSVPLKKSVFRLILARIAELCDQYISGAVTPYGGRGQLAIGTAPPTIFNISFANSTSEQWLLLSPETEDKRS